MEKERETRQFIAFEANTGGTDTAREGAPVIIIAEDNRIVREVPLYRSLRPPRQKGHSPSSRDRH